jgi:hypothetical protein
MDVSEERDSFIFSGCWERNYEFVETYYWRTTTRYDIIKMFIRRMGAGWVWIELNRLSTDSNGVFYEYGCHYIKYILEDSLSGSNLVYSAVSYDA